MNTLISEDIQETFINNYLQFQKENGEQSLPWINSTRESALHNFKKIGLPGNKNEEYKYSNIARALKRKFGSEQLLPAEKNLNIGLDKLHIPDFNSYRIVTVNGKFSHELSNLPSINGIEILPMEMAIEIEHPGLKKYLDTETTGIGGKDPFALLNTAFTNDGVFININNDLKLDKPIFLYNISHAADNAVHFQAKNILLTGKNCEIDIIDMQSQLGDAPLFANRTTGILVEANSKVSFYKIQNESPNTLRVDNSFVSQRRDSSFNSYVYSFNGNMIRNNLNVSLHDENCETHMYGLYITKGKTHIDNHTSVDHIMPHSFSNENYKGILDDQSSGVFNGKIYVRKEAQKTNAFQSNKNILLSNEASISTKPQLEIWADDVKCSHGCTTGQIDDEHLFYLRSRGLSVEKARVLLLHAFTSDILEKVKIESLYKYLDELISERLH